MPLQDSPTIKIFAKKFSQLFRNSIFGAFLAY